MKEPPASSVLQLMPQPVTFLQQRHVARVLEVGLTDHARAPVRAAAIMRRTETIDPQHPQPARRQLKERGATHAANTKHNCVVTSHGFAAEPERLGYIAQPSRLGRALLTAPSMIDYFRPARISNGAVACPSLSLCRSFTTSSTRYFPGDKFSGSVSPN